MSVQRRLRQRIFFPPGPEDVMLGGVPPSVMSSAPPRKLRVIHYSTWVDDFEPAAAYLQRQATRDLTPRVANANDPELMRMARLDCDWHNENVRCFAAMAVPGFAMQPALVVGARGLLALVQRSAMKPADEEWWLIFAGQEPKTLASAVEKLGLVLRRNGLRLLYYAFDEASRTMPGFRELAPSLDVLIHDESPLDPAAEQALRPECLRIHRSWVANVIPYSIPFCETPERKIVFLGSKLGLSPHRQRQLAFLEAKLGAALVAIHDHSLAVADRGRLAHYQAAWCPEGRKFPGPTMSKTHTDRPFWAGCMGVIPISENSVAGDRLEPLHASGLILRYDHGDLESLWTACQRALDTPIQSRRLIYDHFNREETIAQVVSQAISRHAESRVSWAAGVRLEPGASGQVGSA